MFSYELSQDELGFVDFGNKTLPVQNICVQLRKNFFELQVGGCKLQPKMSYEQGYFLIGSRA